MAFTTGKSAFSLVELSIVLVILGLLVGGVLSGQSLIRAAQIRSVSTDYQKYSAAIYSFRDKYFALPGDMPNATNFWGTAAGAGNDSTCYNAVENTTATCNGDADGTIGSVTYSEMYLIWKHLANAQLIEGRYIGTDATNSGDPSSVVPAKNMPSTKMSSSGYWQIGYVSLAGDALNFALPSGSPLALYGASLTPADAWNIDTKVDDGLPGTGKIIVKKLCSTAAGVAPPGDATAKYDLSGTTTNCRIWMYY